MSHICLTISLLPFLFSCFPFSFSRIKHPYRDQLLLKDDEYAHCEVRFPPFSAQVDCTTFYFRPMKAVNTIFGFEVMTCYHLVALSLLPFLPRILGLQNYTYQDLQLCALNTVELSNLGPGDNVEPCVIFDVQPFPNASFAERSSRISIVQVTPSTCGNHRDGAFTGVQVLNAENDGKGTAIGFNQDHYVKLRLVSVVAGNPATLSEEEYKRRHKMILRSLLTSLEAPYIIGTCSFASSIEKDPALEHKAILMAQVGPPGFYLDGNPYVFGFHINSDTYPLPNVRALEFLAAKSEAGLSSIPITVISRTKSEFFASTCRSAIDSLKSAGFTQLTELFFDHSADNDRDGEVNQFDEDFLIGLADLACPPGSGDDDSYHPALFVCTLTEHDVILRRWLETGCSPTSIWVTAATWGWATSNRKAVPYFQGGGQWHESFNYADSYFESGQDLLNHNRRVFGYFGNYDQVVSYSIPHLFSRHLASHYRVVDTPNPTSDFQDNDERELLRRGMIVLTAETLFGPVSFNEVQRNVGREAAGTQWLPLSGGKEHENALISPLLQAEAQIVIPGLNTLDCDSGSFLNDTLLLDQGGLMLKSCSECPNNTFSKVPARLKECRPCPIGSSTGELDVNEFCAFRDDNLLSSGMLAFGYTAVATTWMFSIGFISWILYHRNDAVVKVSQIEFMVLICLGAMISSSTIVALSQQAGSDDDIKAASIGCTMAPFLYAIGWVLQYACLTAKTYRLFKVMQNTERMKRKTVRFFEMFRIVLAALFADLTILVCWAALSPLVVRTSVLTIACPLNSNSIGSILFSTSALKGVGAWTRQLEWLPLARLDVVSSMTPAIRHGYLPPLCFLFIFS